MKYARIENGAVVAIRNMPENFDPDEVAHKFDFRLYNQLPDPAYDPAAEKLGGMDYTINPDSVDGVRVVVPMTQAEIDAYAEAQVDAAELEQVRAIYLDLKNGVGTSAVRLTRCERVLAYMLKRDYKP